jgi:hypothetical protein
MENTPRAKDDPSSTKPNEQPSKSLGYKSLLPAHPRRVEDVDDAAARPPIQKLDNAAHFFITSYAQIDAELDYITKRLGSFDRLRLTEEDWNPAERYYGHFKDARSRLRQRFWDDDALVGAVVEKISPKVEERYNMVKEEFDNRVGQGTARVVQG